MRTGAAVDPWLANSETVESAAQRVPAGPAGTLVFPQPPQAAADRGAGGGQPDCRRHRRRPGPGRNRRPGPGRQPRPEYGRRPRRWPTVLVVAVAAAIAAAGTVYGVTYLTERSATPPAAGATTEPPEPYVRSAVPSWLPPGWSKVIDDESKASVVAGPATNGGRLRLRLGRRGARDAGQLRRQRLCRGSVRARTW